MQYSFLSKNSKLIITLLFACLFNCLGCDYQNWGQDKRQTEGDLSKKFGDLVQELSNNPNLPVEEVQKLHQFEYTVFRVPIKSSTIKIEAVLNEHGKNQWDCFHVEPITPDALTEKGEPSYQFFCKRHPITPLRFVPQSILGR